MGRRSFFCAIRFLKFSFCGFSYCFDRKGKFIMLTKDHLYLAKRMMRHMECKKRHKAAFLLGNMILIRRLIFIFMTATVCRDTALKEKSVLF